MAAVPNHDMALLSWFANCRELHCSLNTACPYMALMSGLSLRSSIAFQASVSTELTRLLVSAVRYHAQKTAAVQTSPLVFGGHHQFLRLVHWIG